MADDVCRGSVCVLAIFLPDEEVAAARCGCCVRSYAITWIDRLVCFKRISEGLVFDMNLILRKSNNSPHTHNA